MNKLPLECNGCDRPCLGNCTCFSERVKALDNPKLLETMLNDCLSSVGV